jgi:hypothetical protein
MLWKARALNVTIGELFAILRKISVMILFQFFVFCLSGRTMLGGSLVTTAWRVLRLWMEGSPLVMEGSCEYTE